MKTLPRKNYLSIVEVQLDHDFLKAVIANLPIAYAYHKVILDNYEAPVDYEFLYVNQAFEDLTGLKGKDIINRRITEVLPNIRSGSFDWIKYYGEVAMNGGRKVFEQYSAPFNKSYKIQVSSPEKYYFTTIFIDISEHRVPA